MTHEAAAGGKRTYSKLLGAVGFCIACIAINVVGAQLALALRLPIYLDCLGTLLAAMVGGFIPAIAVGFLTNLVNSIADSSLLYYGAVNVFIALMAAFLAKRGWFKKLHLTLLSIVIFTLIAGGLGSILTYYLSGAHFGEGVSAAFATQLFNSSVLDMATAQLCADLFVDFVDKTVVVLFAAILYNILPEELLNTLDFIPWMQNPLTKEELDATLHTMPRGVSLRTKFVVIVATIMVLLAITTTVISYFNFHRSMVEEESMKAVGITNLMAQAVNPNRVDDYLEQGDSAPGFAEAESKLAKIRDSFEGVQYVYVYQILEDGCHVVLDPDTAEEEGSDPGDVIPFDPSFEKYVPTLLEGDEIEPVVSNDSYGWLLTVYTPLRNSAGNTVCYLAVDISMAHLVSDELSFLVRIISLFAAFFILVCAVVLWLAKYSIVVPVNSISRATSNFMVNNDSARVRSADQIKKLDIHTGDEIENLHEALSQMSQDAVRYIAEAQEHNDTIARMQSNLIMVMADLVESRDKFTGDHVRNTATYTQIIMDQMRCEGIYPDELTNEFISNVYKSAPLHDVGKIVVSDTILNKPGRFTDEEFKIMKSHTIAGRDILESAKGAVSESSYLDEAQNLAAYHHEKWNGTGYPHGLSGEDIPLSARIMAVADVFDALVSKRSYKEGFPIEKALSIIEEGIGTHFDPQVARAFLHAQDKARVVAEKSNAKKSAEEENSEAQDDSQTLEKHAEDNAS